MKRKLKWLAIVLAVSLLGFGTALLLWPRDRITEESFDKIRIGMTEDEVAEILGDIGCDFDSLSAVDQKVVLGVRAKAFDATLDIREDKIWVGRHGIIGIRIDEGRVGVNMCYITRGGEQTWIDRLRDWLGW